MQKEISRASNISRAFSLGNLNTPAKASLLYTAANFLSRFCSLVFTPFFTRIMPISDYGRFSLFQAYLSILVAIGTLEMGGAVILRAFARFRGEEDRVLLSSFFLTAFVCCVCTVVFTMLFPKEKFFPGAQAMLILSVIGTSFINLFAARCKYFYKAAPFFIFSLATSFISPALALLAIKLGIASQSGTAAVRQGAASIVSAACATVILLYTLYRIRRRGEEKSSIWRILKYLLRLCLPMLPYYASVMLISQIDKIAVEQFLGADMLAKYSVALSAALGISVVSAGLSQILSGWLIRRGRDAHRTEKVCSISLTLLCIGVIAYLSLAPELFRIIAPQSYGEALICIYPLTVSVIPTFLCGIFTSITLLDEKCAPAAFSGIAALIMNFILLRSFTEKYGLFFAALAHLAAYAFLCIAFLFLTRKSFKCAYSFGIKYLTAMLICAFGALIEYRLSDNLAIRILILAASGIAALYVLFKNKNMIFEKTERVQ